MKNNEDITDYTGLKFNSWTIIRFDNFRYKTRNKFWICRCECGIERAQMISTLKTGKSKSCGCSPPTIHGMARHKEPEPEYKAWGNMKSRCYNPHDISYHNYGGRGIKVCEFLRFSAANLVSLIGNRPGKTLSVDRADTNGNYSCGTCPECIKSGWNMNLRWATKLQQAQNRRNSVFVTVNGISKPVSEFAREVGLCSSSIHRRLKAGKKEQELLLPQQHNGGRPFLV